MATDEWDDMQQQEDDELNEEPLDDSAGTSGKYDKLLGSDSKRYKLSGMFKDWFLDYSSYVILQRAVPHIVDGLKPVQRRVLHAMYKMDDGSYTKVANIVGQAMQYHPHGDASILGALVQLGLRPENHQLDDLLRRSQSGADRASGSISSSPGSRHGRNCRGNGIQNIASQFQ